MCLPSSDSCLVSKSLVSVGLSEALYTKGLSYANYWQTPEPDHRGKAMSPVAEVHFLHHDATIQGLKIHSALLSFYLSGIIRIKC